MYERYQRLIIAMGIGNLALVVLVVTLVWGENIVFAIGQRAPVVSQNVPQTMNYQGFLTDDSGIVINGQRDMAFRIYSVMSGGEALWEEIHTGVAINEGVFSVQLGSQGSVITDGLFSEATRWIEIEVESVVLTPRQLLGSVPYAFNASRLNGQTPSELLNSVSGPPRGAIIWFRDNITPVGYTRMDRLGLDIGVWDPINVPSNIDARSCRIWTGSHMLCLRDGAGAGYDPITDTWTPFTTTNAPTITLYSGFSTIWTGSDVIVWGGADYVNIGARYHFASDTWYPVTTTNAPIGRSNHGAVWTGSEMLIWGGMTDSGYTQTGAKYDPITDSWMPITIAGAPSARYGSHLFWTGSQVIVWGGTVSGGSSLDGALYDPVTDSWTSMNVLGGPTNPICNASVLWTGTEMMMFSGYADMCFYNPDTNTWRKVFRHNPNSGSSTCWAVMADNLLVTREGVYDLPQDKWLALANDDVSVLNNKFWTGDSVLVPYRSSDGNILLQHAIDLIYPYVKD